MDAKYGFGLILTLLLLGLLTTTPVAARQDAPETICVVLVLDESGSMAENDPDFVRNTGARLLVTLLDAGDRIGIVRFATRAARVTQELVTLQTPADKRSLLTLLEDTPAEGYTDLRAGLAEAVALLQRADCDRRHLVLLSDGAPALPDDLPDGYLEDTVALVRELNAPVFAIALTAEGESPLLYRLAAATDPKGVVIPARTAGDLLDAYLDVVAHLKDRTVVGAGTTTAPGTAQLPLPQGLAQYVPRATYVVSTPDGVTATLVAPGGRALSPQDEQLSFAYTAEPGFAVYTVEHPPPGPWHWRLEGSGTVQARAILRSRLRVAVDAPGPYHPQGEPMLLAVRLIEEGDDGTATTLIGEAAFSAQIERPDGRRDALDRLYDDGTPPGRGDRRAGDGTFTARYVNTDLAGEYRITVTGYKGPIPVTRRLRVRVVAFPQPRIRQPDVGPAPPADRLRHRYPGDRRSFPAQGQNGQYQSRVLGQHLRGAAGDQLLLDHAHLPRTLRRPQFDRGAARRCLPPLRRRLSAGAAQYPRPGTGVLRIAGRYDCGRNAARDCFTTPGSGHQRTRQRTGQRAYHRRAAGRVLLLRPLVAGLSAAGHRLLVCPAQLQTYRRRGAAHPTSVGLRRHGRRPGLYAEGRRRGRTGRHAHRPSGHRRCRRTAVGAGVTPRSGGRPARGAASGDAATAGRKRSRPARSGS